MSSLNNCYTTKLKAAPAIFLPRDDDDGNLSVDAEGTNVQTTSQNRVLSMSFGGGDSSSFLQRIPPVPQANQLPQLHRYVDAICFGRPDCCQVQAGGSTFPDGQFIYCIIVHLTLLCRFASFRYISAGGAVASVTYSGYLYKRSNNPHMNPSDLISSSSASPTHHPPLVAQHHLLFQQSRQERGAADTAATLPTAASTPFAGAVFVEPSGFPVFPEMPGIFAGANLAPKIPGNRHHAVRGSRGFMEDHQVPELNMMTMMSPPSHHQEEHAIPWQHQRQPTPMIAGASQRYIVTPSPVNAIESGSAENNSQLQPQQQPPQQPAGAQEEQDAAEKREKKNPLQMGLESAAAFFGIRMDDGNGKNREGEATDTDVDSVSCLNEGQPPKTTTEPTRDPATSLFSTTVPQMIKSSPPITITSKGRGVPTPSRPIPSRGRQRESFHDASHRRHSAPTDMAYSSCEGSPSDFESLLGSNGNDTANGIPRDYYDLKDGHLWRAKYCVLENGILYFYRNVSDGESAEAAAERKRSPLQPAEVEPRRLAPSATVAPVSTVDGSISRRRSSAQDLSKSPMPVPMFHHLDSNGSSDAGSCMWEKRVFMDCVGGVRTAEQQYGHNAFELIALGDDEFDQGHVDTLVLQASNPSEMKEWIFQFHRSLASFVRNIMDVFGSTSTSGAFLDIHHPTGMLLADPNRQVSTSSSGTLLPGATPPSPSEKQLQLLYAVSPRFHHKQHSASHFLPSQQTLSHGHGRTSLKRRTDNRKHDNGAASLSSTPETRDSDSPLFQFAFHEPSPSNQSHSPEVISPPTRFLIPPPTNGSKGPTSTSNRPLEQHPRVKSSTSPLPNESDLLDRSLDGYAILPPKPPMGKYTPPHLRNKSDDAPKSKYVPPHLRRQQGGISGGNTSVTHLRNGNRGTDGVPAQDADALPNGSRSLAERAQSAPTMPPNETHETIRNEAIDQLDVVGTTTISFVRGGCADPELIQGSILDRTCIPKGASRVGKGASQPFGSYGGGRSSGTKHRSGSAGDRSLRWEAGAVSECGVREYNEDAYLIANDLLAAFKESSYGQPQTAWKQEDADHSLGLFAVFDGHLGNQAARFAVEILADFIHDQLQMESNGNGNGHNFLGGNSGDSPFSPSSVESVLLQAMIKMDDRFCQLCQEDGRDWESGATALVAMFVNEHVVIANLGDCRGVLCRFVEDTDSYETDVSWSELTTIAEDELSSERTNDLGDAIATQRCFWKEVTTVHTPSAETERLRIEEANGWIRTDIEIPMAQLRRMDFSDEDVIRILKRCFNYFETSNDTPTSDTERSVKECKAAPQRILDISRVCGELSVSRALGDRDFKAAFNSLSKNDTNDDDALLDSESDEPRWWDSPLFLPYPENHNRRFRGDLVSNIPDFQRVRVGEAGVSGEFLLLACDGLFDVMDSDDAVRVARDLLFRKKWTAKKAAARLAELAMHLGSSDNVTVVLIRIFSGTAPDGS
jgi:serine/threonine protein phosphatase PrpC